MSPWEQKLKDSGIVDAITSVEARLDKYSSAELSIEDRGQLDRIRAFTDQLRSVVENSDPRTINFTSISSVLSNLSNIASYIDSWDGGVSSAYLSSHAMQQVDAALQQMPLVSSAVNIPDAKAAITNLRRSAARNATIVDEVTEKIRAKGSLADETVDERINTFKEEIETQAEATKAKLDTIDTEAEEISEQLVEVKAAANKLTTDQTEVFNTAQTERAKKFEEMIKDHQDEAYGVFTSISSKVAKDTEDVKARAETSADLADKARIKSEELLEIVGQNSLISDYSKNAKREWVSSLVWQIISTLSIVIAVIVAGFLAHEASADMAWQKFVAKMAIVLATGSLAAYAARQASEHRSAQRQSEYMSLQLSAVGPYLASIDNKENRDTLLMKLAERFFDKWQPKEVKQRRSKNKDDDEKPVISGDDLPGLIGALISIVNTVNKK